LFRGLKKKYVAKSSWKNYVAKKGSHSLVVQILHFSALTAGNSMYFANLVRTCSKRQIGKMLHGQNGGSKIPSHSLQYQDLGSMIKHNQKKLKSRHCRPDFCRVAYWKKCSGLSGFHFTKEQVYKGPSCQSSLPEASGRVEGLVAVHGFHGHSLLRSQG
jgi:hypothetical protein